MKKLKSFSEIKSFENLKIQKSNLLNIVGGMTTQTLNITTRHYETCDYSCQDSATGYYNDGVLYQSIITESNIDC